MKPQAILVLLFLLFNLSLRAQHQSYFQQKVDYTIKATLHDSTHTLEANLAITYQNNSPDTLREIWMHLWGNAFKNRKSAFCTQKLKEGDRSYYFAKEKDRGGISGLDFKSNGQKMAWTISAEHPDVAVLTLPGPLAPGGVITFSTPYTLKIPASFSRLGHVETSYQMTQWYPKPAVYDHKGWHAMPYLDIGEFYSEFGTFDVSITLPDNYVVGATGLLQTESEILFLQKKETETRARLYTNDKHTEAPFPASSKTMKTIRYTAEHVHDFAWFADKRFMVLKDTAHLESGKSVDCWAMFPMTKESRPGKGQSRYWEKGAFYVKRAVEFYSKHVGEYPYPQATAVLSALSAGGGMEYPMITVIGNSSSAESLDEVITHEVGHNWFYGVLATNERDHPYLDEGFNTYYQARYMKEYYGRFGPAEMPKFLLNEKKQGTVMETGYLLLARERQDTPPDTHSDEFTSLTYGLQVYMKTAMFLEWLEKSIGTAKFDVAMKDYYEKWQFSHPYPEDVKAVFQENNLKADWFFRAMETQDQMDWKLSGVQRDKAKNGYQLTIKNKGKLDAPFSVTALSKGKEVSTRWFSADEVGSDSRVFFPVEQADAFEIDYERVALDLNRKNNFRKTHGLLPGVRPLELRLLAPVQNSRKNTLAITPWAGWNNTDKIMLGLMIYNPPVPSRKFQYYLLPGYGLGSGQWVGTGNLRYHFFPGGLFPKVAVSLGYKSFNIAQRQDGDITDRFTRWMPQVRAQLRSSRAAFEHALVFRTMLLERDYKLLESERNATQKNTIYELRYEGEQWKAPHPFQYQVALETQGYTDPFGRDDNYVRLTAEWKQKFYYQEKRKISMRVFAGGFLQSSRSDYFVNEYSLALAAQGINDYRFDQLFLARNGADNLLGRQVSRTDGGFKGPISAILPGQTGLANQYMVTMNLMADLPFKLPLRLPVKPYFDLGYFQVGGPEPDRQPAEPIVWSGGLALSFFKGGLEFYFPLLSSDTLQEAYESSSGAKYPKMITWSLKMNFQEPVKLLEKLSR